VVEPVVQDNRQFYSPQAAGVQVGAGLATSAFQTAVMVPAGFADMAGAALTSMPDRSVKGFFADTLNMMFSVVTRTAKATTDGIAGDSIFDTTLTIANLSTELALAASGVEGMGRGAASVGRHLNAAAKAMAKTVDYLTPAPAAALMDGGLMMAADEHAIISTASEPPLATRGGKVLEAVIDEGATARKAALDEALQVPTPSFCVCCRPCRTSSRAGSGWRGK
jgi:hypothetical protein